jgi:NADPH-dependent F420 reductase
MQAETVALVGGTGDQGTGLALRWAQAGRHVLVGSRSRSKAEDAVKRLTAILGAAARIEGLENAAAVERAPVVVLTVPFEAQISTLQGLRSHFRPGQLFVDVTVPLEASVGGSPGRVLGVWAGSAAEQSAQLVPAGVQVTAAFHNVSARALQQLNEPIECDVIVCGQSADARQAVRPWVEAIHGCRYVDGGKLENARIVESITALLIGINRRHKVAHSGIRITGLPSVEPRS